MHTIPVKGIVCISFLFAKITLDLECTQGYMVYLDGHLKEARP